MAVHSITAFKLVFNDESIKRFRETAMGVENVTDVEITYNDTTKRLTFEEFIKLIYG